MSEKLPNRIRERRQARMARRAARSAFDGIDTLPFPETQALVAEMSPIHFIPQVTEYLDTMVSRTTRVPNDEYRSTFKLIKTSLQPGEQLIMRGFSDHHDLPDHTETVRSLFLAQANPQAHSIRAYRYALAERWKRATTVPHSELFVGVNLQSEYYLVGLNDTPNVSLMVSSASCH